MSLTLKTRTLTKAHQAHKDESNKSEIALPWIATSYIFQLIVLIVSTVHIGIAQYWLTRLVV